jgi:hypothetical protein
MWPRKHAFRQSSPVASLKLQVGAPFMEDFQPSHVVKKDLLVIDTLEFFL